MDWRKLDGPQRAVLRIAILDAFADEVDFNKFLNDKLNKKKLDVFAGGDNFEDRIFNMINDAVASGWINKFVPALQEYRADSAPIQELPTAIRLAQIQITNRIASPELTLEKIVSGGGFEHLRIWLERMTTIGRSVCRIEFPVAGVTIYGTGFLIADDLVLTNYHLIQGHIDDGLASKNLQCRFDFAVDSKGLSQGFTVPLAADGGIVAYAAYDKADIDGNGIPDASHLDFALLRLNRPVGADEVSSGIKRGCIKIANVSPMPKPSAPVLIVQHPDKRPMGVSLGIVVETDAGIPRIRYNADTENGSSGSPVLNQKLELIALHHAGDPLSSLQPRYNQGIPIALVVAHLQNIGIAL